MHLFLEGDRGSGKSWLLKEVLKPVLPKVCGYYVQRIFSEGRLLGFQAKEAAGVFGPQDVEWEGETPPVCGEGAVFLSGGKWDVSVLEAIICRMEEQARRGDCRLLFLDEIGGVELLSPVFFRALLRILESDVPCVGVIKSEDNLKSMAERNGIGNEIFPLYALVRKKLEERGQILLLNEESRNDCRKILEDFVKKNTESVVFRPAVKVQLVKDEVFMGPGPFRLLNLIEDTGSVRSACGLMGISYSKAWKILNRLEAEAGVQILLRKHGGKAGGETSLTKEGLALMEQYSAFSSAVSRAAEKLFEEYFEDFWENG